MNKARPNIITIMTDDQGYGDLSCMGSADVLTPHFDRLAASGAGLKVFIPTARFVPLPVLPCLPDAIRVTPGYGQSSPVTGLPPDLQTIALQSQRL